MNRLKNDKDYCEVLSIRRGSEFLPPDTKTAANNTVKRLRNISEAGFSLR